jgi:putative transposase
MVSRKRYFEPGQIYHVVNRGAERRQLFFREDDYREFEALIEETIARIPLCSLTYELMPNHWHFVVKPDDQDQLF